MEINPIKVYVPLGVYNAKYGLKEGDKVVYFDGADVSIPRTLKSKISDKEWLAESNTTKNHTVVSIDNTNHIEVEVIRVCDINFKYIKQQEISFDNGKSV
jgi:hypothetical protein